MLYFFMSKLLILILLVLMSVAFLTLMERKILSLVGLRLGPSKVSIYGFLQPISDAIKLSNKEVNSLSNFSFLFYYSSSFFMLFSAIFMWFTLMSEPSPVSLKLTILLFMTLLGLNSLNSIISGWSTFGKYSLIGSIRTVSQLISYEAVLYLCVFIFLLIYLNFNLYSFNFYPVNLFFLFLPVCLYLWLPSMLADLNRTPYDFSEGESELVSGFNTEFGSKCFTLIFLSEYSNIIFLCLLSSFLFFWSLSGPLFFFFFFFVIWIRSVLPRFRFDKLMYLSWKFFIPLLTLLFIFCFLYYN